MNDLVKYLLPKVDDIIDKNKEYVIYGHSMGVLIAYLMCHKLKEKGTKLPYKLIVSHNKGSVITAEVHQELEKKFHDSSIKRLLGNSTVDKRKFWFRYLNTIHFALI